MSENTEKILYCLTCSGDDSERASLCFAMASGGAAMDVDVTVALQGKGVYLALKGYTDHLPAIGGFAPLKKLISDFMEVGGKVLVCKPCIDERKIEEADLIDGARVTTGGALNMLALETNAQLVY